MNTQHPRFTLLFQQLGLTCSPPDIERFIQRHAPLDPAVRLEEAPFWSQAQAMMIREGWLQDAEWAEVLDQLSLALRRH